MGQTITTMVRVSHDPLTPADREYGGKIVYPIFTAEQRAFARKQRECQSASAAEE